MPGTDPAATLKTAIPAIIIIIIFMSVPVVRAKPKVGGSFYTNRVKLRFLKRK